MMGPIDGLMESHYRRILEIGWFRYPWVELWLPSGRKCRYQLTDFPFRVDATPLEIDAIASRILEDKYKYCQWDREHPTVDTETEIFTTIRDWMLGEIAKVRALRAKLE